MLKIRRIFSAGHEETIVRQVQDIFRHRFSDVAAYADGIPTMLEDPYTSGYRSVLLVAERGLDKVVGFSLILYLPEIRSCLLDFIAVAPGVKGGGMGSALYEGTREFAHSVKARALYLEALPDDPELEPDPELLKENRLRLQFYERYGVRPVVGTAFETPIGDGPAPYLLYDDLGSGKSLSRKHARKAVQLILERKYPNVASPQYIKEVVDSFRDDPVRIREPKRPKQNIASIPVEKRRLASPFIVVFSENHVLHHVNDRGYVERPARVRVIMESLNPLQIFEKRGPKHFGESVLRTVHSRDFVSYLKLVCKGLSAKRPVYPYVFPIRRPERQPKDKALRAGYYCMDTFTPLSKNSYEAARAAVDVALTAAEEVLHGRILAYAVCRPPGHHAERRIYGGFCYFNNAAIAADYIVRRGGRVAILDVDFHHFNGTQDIFYNRSDVFTISIHGHPSYAYPYFSGFADERGVGEGKGFNRNFPLHDGCSEEKYLETMERAFVALTKFKPNFLVVSLGFDTMKGDPTGGFLVTPRGMGKIGRRLMELRVPTLVVQEGGYSLTNLRLGARAFFQGAATALK